MISGARKVEQLSPDGYTRFFILTDIIQDLYKTEKRTLKILDVGGGSEFMRQRLDKIGIAYKLTIIDIIEKPKGIRGTYIKGDATAMQFADNSFDVVISTDVMEHIPEDKKPLMLKECLRVAKEVCIIAAPFDTVGVSEAEIAVNEFNRKLFGKGQSWLMEHLELGKPKLGLFKSTLEEQGIAYIDFGTQNLNTWLLNTHLNLIEARLGLSSRQHTKINEYYNQNIFQMNEFVTPTYRHFFVIYLDSKKQSQFDLKKYIDTKTDYSKLTKYTSDLLGLVANRIEELNSSNTRLGDMNVALHSEVHSLREENRQLKQTVQNHERALRYIRPFVKMVKNPRTKKVYPTMKKG